MKKVLALLLLLISGPLAAQDRPYTTNNKPAIQAYNSAHQSLDYRLYSEAITKLNEAVTLDPNFLEAQNQLADVLRLTKKYGESIIHYLKVIATNADFNRAVYLNLSDAEINLGKYEDAKANLVKYLSFQNLSAANKQYAELLLSDCEYSIKAVQNPVPFKPVNLGAEINSADDEYMPVTTADESTLIFTRKIKNNEDFYKSSKKEGKWNTAVYLSNQINTPDYNEGAQSITQDGAYLFFTGCDRPQGLGKCDIYVAKKNGDDWDVPYNLNAPINTRNWESQPTISADGHTLYFVSNRKGGYGGYDIWKSTLSDKGWSEPENLGPNINTPYDEQSPFIHPDDNTLYFSSNGWPGLGNMDVFISRRDGNGEWQKPINLGYPINSFADDSGLTLNANGNLAYFSSKTLKGYGGFDIYQFEMPVNLQPQPATYVKGVITDAESNKPLQADVAIVNLSNNKRVYYHSSDKQGNFLSTLTYGKDYALNIYKKGYLLYSENFSIHDLDVKKQFNISISMQSISAGKKMVLKNIFFDTDKYDLKPESKTELEKLLYFLTDNPKAKIEISGYTDNQGNDFLNNKLSENRAKAVYQFLTQYQIDAKRISYRGYGKLMPVATNADENGRRQNRRTEFTIVSN